MLYSISLCCHLEFLGHIVLFLVFEPAVFYTFAMDVSLVACAFYSFISITSKNNIIKVIGKNLISEKHFREMISYIQVHGEILAAVSLDALSLD